MKTLTIYYKDMTRRFLNITRKRCFEILLSEKVGTGFEIVPFVEHNSKLELL